MSEIREYSGHRYRDRALTALLVLLVLASVGALWYSVANPITRDSFTDFYVLGPERLTSGYPEIFMMKNGAILSVQRRYAEGLRQASDGAVLVGVVNHERMATTYTVEITIDGESVWVGDKFALGPGERWEQTVSLIPTKTGPSQKVEFRLHKSGIAGPYRTVYFWVSVKQVG